MDELKEYHKVTTITDLIASLKMIEEDLEVKAEETTIRDNNDPIFRVDGVGVTDDNQIVLIFKETDELIIEE